MVVAKPGISGSAGSETLPFDSLSAAGIPQCGAGKLTEPIKALKDKYELLPAFLRVRGLVRQHIDSFNYFINHEMRNIIHAKGNERVTCDTDPNFYLKCVQLWFCGLGKDC